MTTVRGVCQYVIQGRAKGLTWLLAWAAVWCLGGSAVAQSDQISIAVLDKSGQPGDYLTLPFTITGPSGYYRYEVMSPPEWQPLTPKGEVVLEPPADAPTVSTATVGVTFRVPSSAHAGQPVPIELRLYPLQEHVLLASASAHVGVQAKARLSLYAPREFDAKIGATETYVLSLKNLGNERDTVRLSYRGTTWDVNFSPEVITLMPQEGREIEVMVKPTSTVSNGYKNVLIISAASDNNPEVSTSLDITTTYWLSGEPEPGIKEARDPQITVGFSANLGASLKVDDDVTETRLHYGLAGSVGGELSDFIEATLDEVSASGNQDFDGLNPLFSSMPTSFGVRISGEEWAARARISQSQLRLETSFAVPGWKLSLGSSYNYRAGATFAFTANAISTIPDLDLQLSAGTFFNHGERLDLASVMYRRELLRDLNLSIGATVSGTARDPYGSGAYDVNFNLSESLSWRTPYVTLVQSYSGRPFDDVHNLGISASSRGLGMFGVRGRSTLKLADDDLWDSVLTLYFQPLPELYIGVSGGYGASLTGGGLQSQYWEVKPALNYSTRLTPAMLVGLKAQYGHKQYLADSSEGAGGFEDDYLLSAYFNFNYHNFALSADARYQAEDSHRDPFSAKVSTNATAAYTSGNTTIEGRAGFETSLAGDQVRNYRYGIRWKEQWTPHVSTNLAYALDYQLNPDDRLQESVSAVLSWRNFLLQGLVLSAGYTLKSEGGFFADGELKHNVVVGLGLDSELSLPTPDAVVNLFGGRASGLIEGMAFVDHNLNKRFDVGERALENLQITLGEYQTLTNAQGFYQFQIPEGTYRMAFLEGLPATLDLLGERMVVLSTGDVEQRNLAFAPVTSVYVSVYDDTNHNGRQDEGETPIPYAGLQLTGLVSKETRTNSYGHTTLTGLPSGEYTLAIDPEMLPPKYKPQGEPMTLLLDSSQEQQEVVLAASLPKRQVVSTFSSGDLAVIGLVRPTNAAAGSLITVEAIVSGQAQQVRAEVAGQEVFLNPSVAGRYQAEVRLPLDTPPGVLMIPIKAIGGGKTIDQTVFFTVTQDKPFSPSRFSATRSGLMEIDIELVMAAEEAYVVLPSGGRLKLVSDNGTRWRSSWRSLPYPAVFTVPLYVDGQLLGELELTVKDYGEP